MSHKRSRPIDDELQSTYVRRYVAQILSEYLYLNVAQLAANYLSHHDLLTSSSGWVRKIKRQRLYHRRWEPVSKGQLVGLDVWQFKGEQQAAQRIHACVTNGHDDWIHDMKGTDPYLSNRGVWAVKVFGDYGFKLFYRDRVPKRLRDEDRCKSKILRLMADYLPLARLMRKARRSKVLAGVLVAEQC